MTTCQAMAANLPRRVAPRRYPSGPTPNGRPQRTSAHAGLGAREAPSGATNQGGRDSMATMQDVEAWRGRTLVDRDGDKIGTIEDVYLDRSSGEPEWVAVKTGMCGSKVSFVPIRDASETGDDVRVSHEKDLVKDAPKVDADGELSPEEERRLYQHYGRSDYDEWTTDSEDRTEGTLGRDDRMSFDRERSGGTDIGRGDAESRGDLEAR